MTFERIGVKYFTKEFIFMLVEDFMRSFSKKLLGIALSVGLTVPALAQDPTFVWTGNGADDLISNSANWPTTMGSQFFQNHYGLHTTAQRGTYVIPAGNTATVYGFDITNVTLDFDGDIISVRNPSFNGFWMRNNMTVILGPNGSYTFQQRDGSADAGQITMQGENNRIEYHMQGTLPFQAIFVGAYDGNGGKNNHLEQHAGKITSEFTYVGTMNTGGTEQNTLTLYGGTYEVSNTLLVGLDTARGTHGNGAVNIYGGALSTVNMSGATATIDGAQFVPSVDLFIGGVDGTDFGTFALTGNNTFSGDINVQMAMPLTVLDSSILNTNIVSLSTVGNTKVNLGSELFTTANDGKTVILDASKKLAGSDNYAVNETLALTTPVSEGWIELPDSSNPFTVELSASGLDSMTAAEEFAAWLGEDFFANATALDQSTIQLTFSPENGDDIFMFDFTDYAAANVKLQGFSTSDVPEPSAWALMLLSAAGLVTLRSRKRK